MSTTDFDRIEREIAIDASPERVWELVSEPGWYINDSAIVEHRLEERGELTVVHDPKYGEFAFRIVQLDRPQYAAFRWHINPDPSSSSTLVEFWITPTDSGVLLRVAESGFESLSEPEADRRSRFDDHTQGWPAELELARVHLVGQGSGV